MDADSRHVILVMGVCGCGKSTVGQRLSESLGAHFVEADAFHPPSNVEKMRSGVPLNDADRAPWLAALNDRMRELQSLGVNHIVVACSALKRAYRERLREGLQGWVVVFLDGTEARLRERLAARTDHFMPVGMLESQLATLERPEGALCVSVELSVKESVQSILRTLKSGSGTSIENPS